MVIKLLLLFAGINLYIISRICQALLYIKLFINSLYIEFI